MITAAAMRAMAAAGLSAGQIADVVEADRAETREYEASRKARYRARLKNVPGTDNPSLCDVPGVPGTNRHIDNLPSLSLTEDSLKERKKERGVTRARAKRVPIPEGWSVSEAGRCHAFSHGWDETKLAGEVDRFVNHALANGRLCANWNAAWNNWVTSPYQSAQRNGNGAPRRGSRDDRAERTQAMLDKLSGGGLDARRDNGKTDGAHDVAAGAASGGAILELFPRAQSGKP